MPKSDPVKGLGESLPEKGKSYSGGKGRNGMCKGPVMGDGREHRDYKELQEGQ